MIITKIKGGLGNQLFQYAAALNISQTLNQSVMIDTSFYKEDKYKGLFRLDKFRIDFQEANQIFNFSKKIKLSDKLKYFLFRKTFIFPYSGYNVIDGDILKFPLKSLSKLNKKEIFLLDGWLQKRIYFSAISNLLEDGFRLKPNILLDENIKGIISKNNSVAVHVRSGDMAKNANFVELKKDYYRHAIDKIVEITTKPHFIVFSDEPKKAMEMLQEINIQMTFITENSKPTGVYGTKGDYIDFGLMLMCKHFIIANSTFSWWPAYLSKSKSKIVIAPRNWFENKLLQSNFEKSGMLQNNWITI